IQDPELLKNPFLLLPYPPSLCSEPCSSQWVPPVLGFQSPWRGLQRGYGQVAKSGPSSLLHLRLALSSTVAVDDSEVQIDLQMVDA
ncbi:hypothetical protein I314_01168, partial [Cryptococcus bacillisporus CA1873]